MSFRFFPFSDSTFMPQLPILRPEIGCMYGASKATFGARIVIGRVVAMLTWMSPTNDIKVGIGWLGDPHG